MSPLSVLARVLYFARRPNVLAIVFRLQGWEQISVEEGTEEGVGLPCVEDEPLDPTPPRTRTSMLPRRDLRFGLGIHTWRYFGH